MLNGANGRTRTGDLRITSALLYQLSHVGMHRFKREAPKKYSQEPARLQGRNECGRSGRWCNHTSIPQRSRRRNAFALSPEKKIRPFLASTHGYTQIRPCMVHTGARFMQHIGRIRCVSSSLRGFRGHRRHPAQRTSGRARHKCPFFFLWKARSGQRGFGDRRTHIHLAGRPSMGAPGTRPFSKLLAGGPGGAQ